MDLTGCRCLIVGGSRHLGRALAIDLAAGGAPVVVSSRSLQQAQATAADALGVSRSAIAVLSVSIRSRSSE